ncbi:hypothetical protein A0U91_14425 [Acetobacter persici]|uniref:Uncharacterized protein n=1 Tax=Acetobacter persici TaxID=1076596 RepID=A0A1U9LHD9_9PROT|nr:hypothetical protein A0U91_14425 [Acetobacter persici]
MRKIRLKDAAASRRNSLSGQVVMHRHGTCSDKPQAGGVLMPDQSAHDYASYMILILNCVYGKVSAM